jgi:hypothetical protein
MQQNELPPLEIMENNQRSMAKLTAIFFNELIQYELTRDEALHLTGLWLDNVSHVNLKNLDDHSDEEQ